MEETIRFGKSLKERYGFAVKLRRLRIVPGSLLWKRLIKKELLYFNILDGYGMGSRVYYNDYALSSSTADNKTLMDFFCANGLLTGSRMI